MGRTTHSMKWKIIAILLLCWLIPFGFLIGVMGVYVGSNHSDMTALNYQSQLEFNNRICVERLNRAVAESRQASFDGELLKIRKQYLAGSLSYVSAKKQYDEYLVAKYQQNSTISSVVLWFAGENEIGSSSIYNEKANGSYQQIRTYWERDHERISSFASELGTSVGFCFCESSLYLVRNLVDSRYETQGVLILCLNQEYCFDSLAKYPMQDGVCVWIDDDPILVQKNEAVEDWTAFYNTEEEKQYRWIDGQLCVTDMLRGDSYRIYAAMMIHKSVTMFPFYGYQYVMIAMVMALFPLLALMLSVFRKEVTNPIEQLCDGTRHMEEGELGYQIEDMAQNKEFRYLTAAFNQMSAHIKRQFDKIYQEEIALREARIMALQSHINPHFMNNTMEVINWEARMAGNVKVSRMIEALSTMMDAAMDRRKRPEVTLAEEMGYVNSYLYIMKERLGKRLTVEMDIPEELMRYYVPRLILQPLIENAIEHGVVPNGSGMVEVRGWKDDQYLYLETLNDGVFTEQDKERINRLLDMNYNTSKEPSGSLGIANVNQRLRILFGEPCGLTMEEIEGRVVARLTIPVRLEAAQ